MASLVVANYITKLRGLKQNKQKHNDHARKVANYITKLRGLKPRHCAIFEKRVGSCKLYHKTTWFETEVCALSLVF